MFESGRKGKTSLKRDKLGFTLFILRLPSKRLTDLGSVGNL